MTRSTFFVLFSLVCFLFLTNDANAQRFNNTKPRVSSSQIGKESMTISPRTPAAIVDYFTQLDTKKYFVQTSLTTMVGMGNSLYAEGRMIVVKSTQRGAENPSLKGNLTAYKSTARHNNCGNGLHTPHPFNPSNSVKTYLDLRNNGGAVVGSIAGQKFTVIGAMRARDGSFILYGKIEHRQSGIIAITLNKAEVIAPPK